MCMWKSPCFLHTLALEVDWEALVFAVLLTLLQFHQAEMAPVEAADEAFGFMSETRALQAWAHKPTC